MPGMFVMGDKVICEGKRGVVTRVGCFQLIKTCSYQVKYDNDTVEQFVGLERCSCLKKQ